MRVMTGVRLLFALAGALAAVAANYPIQANARYAPYEDTVLDVVQPRDPALKERTAVIVIHGEEAGANSKEDMRGFCTPFLDRDYVAVVMDYRQDHGLEDVLAAAKWFHDRAPDFKADPNHLIALGVSRGGQYALLLGMLPAGNEFGPATKISAVINFGGIGDMALLPTAGRVELDLKQSPIAYVRKDVPPILSIHGDLNQPIRLEQSVRLTQALKAAGAKAELITVNGAKQSFTAEQMAAIWPQVFKWLKKNKL